MELHFTLIAQRRSFFLRCNHARGSSSPSLHESSLHSNEHKRHDIPELSPLIAWRVSLIGERKQRKHNSWELYTRQWHIQKGEDAVFGLLSSLS